MTRYKGWPAWGRWLDTKQNFPASSGKFLGLIQGPPLRVGGGGGTCGGLGTVPLLLGLSGPGGTVADTVAP